MYKVFIIFIIIFLGFLNFATPDNSSAPGKDGLIKVLILSGKNNHEWQKTTPLLYRIFKESKLFEVSVTEKPETLSYNDWKKYDLLISNWNTWPDNKLRMSNQWERDFEKFVNEGGGVLFIHAGASSFYDWEAYHRIGIGRWGKETRHGAPTSGHVYKLSHDHPITKEISHFYIVDEIWENTEIYPGAKAIGWLSAKDEKDGHAINVPALFVNQTGKGRSFFTTLGHDERALLNTGLQTLLQRAGQWCAGRTVTIEVPGEVKIVKPNLPVKWNLIKTDTSVALRNHSEVIWQFNYKNRFGKPYFHPLKVNRTILTCVSPPDHPWHLGLWFSWKFINGINYWEYVDKFSSSETGYQSEGITDVEKTEIVTNPDFSTHIRMKLNYHPVNAVPVLSEVRDIHISALKKDGSYYIDQEHRFTALDDRVILDRTPILGEPGGQSWGGYAGLSIRFNQNFTSPEITLPMDSVSIRKSNLMYMAFKGLTGDTAGTAILQHPDFATGSMAWYVINEPKIPFYYFSPAVLFEQRIILKKGETLELKYRIWMLPGVVSKDKLQEKYVQYLNKIQ